MHGQWIGNYTGTNDGLLVVELDDRGEHFGGTAWAYNNDRSMPTVVGPVGFEKGKKQFSLKVPLSAIQRGTGLYFSEEAIKKQYPDLVVPNSADTEWDNSPSTIDIKWKTDIGTHGEARLTPSEGAKTSELGVIPNVLDWDTFKEYVTKTLIPYRFVFRGQENRLWRLRTSFHRTSRADLLTFMQVDVSNLHRHLSGLTTHRFNLGDDLDYAAFLSLVQHHGYPTPLLDWTRSPFIAAYFAYNNLSRKEIDSDQKVRVHVFDEKLWNTSYERAGVIAPGFMHLTTLEPLAINNSRAVPQQALSTVTNVDDLEKYIRQREQAAGITYLSAFDMPAGERNKVMRELDLMGINAGSLFPGLDGACKQLKERNFSVL